MRLLFKQRLFSWFDSYDIYNEAGETLYTVKGQMGFGHRLKVLDARGHEIGMLKQRIFTWMPKFDIQLRGRHIGCISKKISFFKPKFVIDYNGWQVEGNFLEWDYSILDVTGRSVAVISKQPFHWTDTYVIDVRNEEDALYALMLVLAIDAEKCMRED